jgi:hypothetical protein
MSAPPATDFAEEAAEREVTTEQVPGITYSKPMAAI